MQITQGLIDRFLAKVVVGPDCWAFTGASAGSKGSYGHIRIGPATQRYVYAHRLAFELAFGPIPEGAEIDHVCGNKRCVRYSHLRAVSHRDNLLASQATLPSRMIAKQRCSRGHLLDGVRPNNGWRYCKTCAKACCRAYYRKTRKRG